MKHKKVLISLFLISLFLMLVFLINEKEIKNEDEKIVTKITDGDTIIIQGGERVRLLGIDCDERGKKCYTEAKEWMEIELLNKEVILIQEGIDKDIYGRSLRYIFLDGENINLKLVELGLCISRFDQDSKYKTEIVGAEEKAIKNKIGCKWQDLD
jgi:micrococcal nuclease